jgi:hypothetical protein
MKKIIALALAATLSFSTFGLLVGCTSTSDIEEIMVGTNTTYTDGSDEGATLHTYNVILKDTVDWDNISTAERARIAKAAFEEAKKKVKEDGLITGYSIAGSAWDKQAEEHCTAFMYNINERLLTIFIGGERSDETVSVTPLEL